tara:strand:- start:1013 stop:1153 length:141 start_codon:yes stop_codon:yes gene_type:complete
MKKNKTKEIKYKSQYGVIAICQSETEQIQLYEKLKKQGLNLKVVTV